MKAEQQLAIEQLAPEGADSHSITIDGQLTARQLELLAGVESLLPSLAQAALDEATQNSDISRLSKTYIDIALYNAAVAYIEKLKGPIDKQTAY